LGVTFEEFASAMGPKLRAALVGAYGPNVGIDAAAEALAYGWENWQRVGTMENPTGYLYRVGQTAARRAHRPQGFLPAPSSTDVPDFEPRLLPALEALSEPQRVCVVMVHAYGWGQTDVAELLEVSPSTVRSHLARALANLHHALEGTPHAD
jgi:DNA-directed RNA polymerase specialized sigma24 family protein